MKPLVHATLVNDPFGDPALYLEFMFRRRALLFDLGELQPLTGRKLLRVSHAFVSHTHMDHFVGLDRILRICLGRAHHLHLFGPPGFLERVEHKLAGYTWNLVHNYSADFTITAHELSAGGKARAASFHTLRAFRREQQRGYQVEDGVLLDEPGFQVRYSTLDHGIPSLAFALEEKQHVNILKSRLLERGLPVGPWLGQLKQAVLERRPGQETIAVPSSDGSIHRRALGELRELVRTVPGQKLAYVADCAGHEGNAERIAALAAGADSLYIEASFLEADADEARRKNHLTAKRAGELGRLAGVRRVIPFHFSTRYAGREAELRAEVERGFRRKERI